MVGAAVCFYYCHHHHRAMDWRHRLFWVVKGGLRSRGRSCRRGRALVEVQALELPPRELVASELIGLAAEECALEEAQRRRGRAARRSGRARDRIVRLARARGRSPMSEELVTVVKEKW